MKTNKKTFYTFKNIDGALKSQKAKETRRSILYIATENGAKKKASASRFNTAKKLYNFIIQLNILKENEFYWDENESRYNRAVERGIFKRLEARMDSILQEARPLAKKLNIKINSGTWWHLLDQRGRQIYTNAF